MDAAERNSPGTLMRNSLWNITGLLAPALVAIPALPLLLSMLGIERLGVLMLCWLAIGYFGLFDLGLGRAVTHRIAQLLASGTHSAVPSYIRCAVSAACGLGLFAATAIMVCSTTVLRALKISSELAVEAQGALLLLAGTLPIVMACASLAGALEAHQRFNRLNRIRLLAGIANIVLPLAVSWLLGPDLRYLVLVLAVSRVIQAATLWRAVSADVNAWDSGRWWARDKALELFAYGKWLTVSNIIGPVLEYFDRFLISFILGAAAVAYYTVPYDVLSRLWLVPVALAGVMFPAMTEAVARRPETIGQMYHHSFRAILTTVLPCAAVVVFLAPEMLARWISREFSDVSSVTAQLLAIGVMLNSFARIPHTHVQAEGRADWSARTHILELVPYLALLWYAIVLHGIVGAAAVWTLRIAVDTLVFYWLSYRLQPALRSILLRQATTTLFAAAALLLATLITLPVSVRIGLAILTCLAVVPAAYAIAKRVRTVFRASP